MQVEKLLKEMTPIFEDLFDEENLTLTEKMTADDIEEWDSLTHIHLVVLIENHFKIKFTSSEIGDFNSIGDMTRAISQKLA